MGKERRKYQRVTIKSVAEICVRPGSGKFFAFVGGISRGGLELYGQERLTVNHAATIQLTFLNREGHETRETLDGTVRWCSKLGEAYIAGVEFTTAIEAQDHPALWTYISQYEPMPPLHE